MNEASEPKLEALLADALRPIDPPEGLAGRVEITLSRVAEHAAAQLSSWADELSEGERRALHDPRNWIRPVAAAAAGGTAAGALVLMGLRRRRRSGRLRSAAGDLRGALGRD